MKLEGLLLEAGRALGEAEARAHETAVELARCKEERNRLEVSLVGAGKSLHARTLEAQNLRSDRDELQASLRMERAQQEAVKSGLARRRGAQVAAQVPETAKSSQSEVVMLAAKVTTLFSPPTWAGHFGCPLSALAAS